MKMYLLKDYNPLGINKGSYSFGKFFSFIFPKNTRNLWVFSKIAIVKSNKLDCILGTNLQ